MAFGKAANYSNLPNGVFSPTLFSKKAQMAFRKKAVVEDITNSEYFGEIANFGDTVKIIKEPEITVNPYLRGTQIVPQDLEDVDFTLTIDQANWWAFKLDDIEKQQSHIGWMEIATNRAAYRMADQYDKNVLGYMAGYQFSDVTGLWTARTTSPGTVANTLAGTDEWLSANKLTRASFVSGGSASESIATGVSGTFDATPLQILNRMNRILDINNVDKEGRYIVIDPVFAEILMDENSKLINNDYNPGADQLTNGKLTEMKIRGFRVYMSNNLPVVGTGPGTVDNNGGSAHYGVILAGQDSAVATAQQIDKTETYRDPNSFADVARGLNLYGRKILRPEALVRAWYNINQ
jgi:hypothetical protein